MTFRDYMETVKNLFVYGWYYYPFCTVAGSLSTLIVEMALRFRLGSATGKRPSLKRLFNTALKRGLIQREWASSIDRLDAWALSRNVGPAGLTGFVRRGATTLTGRAVADQAVKFRNSFGHAEFDPVSFPDDALQVITVCSEIINQLWPLAAKERSK